MVCGGHENGTSVWSTHAGNATISGGGTSAFVTMEMDLFKVVAVFGVATIMMVLVRLYAGAFANRFGEWLAGWLPTNLRLQPKLIYSLYVHPLMFVVLCCAPAFAQLLWAHEARP